MSNEYARIEATIDSAEIVKTKAGDNALRVKLVVLDESNKIIYKYFNLWHTKKYIVNLSILELAHLLKACNKESIYSISSIEGHTISAKIPYHGYPNVSNFKTLHTSTKEYDLDKCIASVKEMVQ